MAEAEEFSKIIQEICSIRQRELIESRFGPESKEKIVRFGYTYLRSSLQVLKVFGLMFLSVGYVFGLATTSVSAYPLISDSDYSPDLIGAGLDLVIILFTAMMLANFPRQAFFVASNYLLFILPFPTLFCLHLSGPSPRPGALYLVSSFLHLSGFLVIRFASLAGFLSVLVYSCEVFPTNIRVLGLVLSITPAMYVFGLLYLFPQYGFQGFIDGLWVLPVFGFFAFPVSMMMPHTYSQKIFN